MLEGAHFTFTGNAPDYEKMNIPNLLKGKDGKPWVSGRQPGCRQKGDPAVVFWGDTHGSCAG